MMRQVVWLLPVVFGLACKDDEAGDGGSATMSGSSTAAASTEPGGSSGEATGGPVDPTEGSGGGSSGSTGASAGTTEGPPPGELWAFDHVRGRANVDDDDDNGQDDWLDPRFDGDNELQPQVIPAAKLAALPPGARVRLSLAGQTDQVRAWLGDQVVLGSNQGPPLLEHELEATGGDITLMWEFAGHNVGASLTIAWSGAQGEPGESFLALVRASPLITNHHLQPAEHAWVVDVPGGPNYNNAAMVQAMQATLGDRLTRVPADNYDWDVWIQDEFEWATARSEGGGRLDVVIDSIRDRGLDPMPEDSLVGPDYVAQTWGIKPKTTYDSFGNLDASPPVSVDGVNYPFGRIYYGRRNGEGINAAFADYLVSQEIQRPFELDTTWLCVGHVDEFSTILPDPAAPKGFRLLLADVTSMYALLDGLPDGDLGRYGQDYGYGSVGELRGDPGLRAYNEDLQIDHLDPIRAVFKKELGLDDADIVAIPTLFEPAGGCGALALIPGTVNVAVFNFEGDAPHVFVPDPFFRPGGAGQDEDPIIADFKARAPEGLTLHFVDNWDVYHLSRGEVHCGTNVQRKPIADWWEP